MTDESTDIRWNGSMGAIRTDSKRRVLLDRPRVGAEAAFERRACIARTIWLTTAWFFVLMSLGPLASAQTAAPTEYEIKAACLYNFAKLIDWPEESFASVEAPFSIGILGEDPFGAALERVIRGRTIDGRDISIRRSSGHAHCQLLFISSSETENVARVLETIEKLPLVTVSEVDGFAKQGGVVELFIEDNAVRFAINVDAASRTGVTMDPELLRLSTLVKEDTTLTEPEPSSE